MLPITDPVLQFTVLVVAALVAQLTVERVHLPGLLGLLALGVLLGPGGFEVMPREPIVDFLGHIGLVYVMFMAGLEIDLDTARAHARETVTFGLLAFAASLAPTVAAGLLLLGFSLPSALLLGALISSHTLLAYPVVEQLGLLDRVPVVTAVGGTLITDTLALVLLAVVMSVAGGDAGAAGAAGSAGDGGGALGWIRPLGLLAALVALAAWGVPRLARAFFGSDEARRAEKALFALVVLLVLSSAAEIIGTDEVLGAFLAGITLNGALAEHDELREHIEFAGRMLFIPFFFVYTGMLLDLGDAFQGDVLLLAGLLLVLVAFGKSVAAWVTGGIHDMAGRERLLMVGLTLPQAAATLAVTITASEAGLLDAQVVDAVILVILVTCIAGPVLTSRVGQRVVAGPERGGGRRDTAAGEERPPVRRRV